MRSMITAMYKEAFQRAMGAGSHEPYGNVNITPADFEKRGYPLGARFPSDKGNVVLRWVRVRGAGVVIGSPLKRYLGNAGRTGTMSAATKTTATSADTLTNADIAGALLSIFTGTGLGQHRPILESNEAVGASVLSTVAPELGNYIDIEKMPEIWNPVLDATSQYSIYADWEVTRQTADTDPVSSVALGTVDDGNFTLVVTKGPALVDCAGNTDAITANGLVVPSSTAGRAKGIDMTPADVNVALREAALYFGIGLHGWTAASGLALVDILGRFEQ